MTALRALLVDDEPLALERLAALLDEIDDVEIVGTAGDGRSARLAVEELKPDIVLLDVQMPEQNGLRVAAELGGDGRPEIIFVTAFDSYAADAFGVDAADYLLKPVRADRLRQAIERAKRRKRLRALEMAEPRLAPTGTGLGGHHDEGIWVQTRNGAVFVPVETIEWIEAARDYVILHTPTRSHLVRMSMRALEEKLDPAHLMRVHRSAFARASNVVEVQRMGKTINALVMRDGAVVQVGPNYSTAIATRLNLHSAA